MSAAGVHPTAAVGILGGGQLGRMLALAGVPLGVEALVVEPAPDAPAAAAAEVLAVPYDDPGALDALAERCDVVTYEFENVPVAALDRLDGRVRVAPGPASLAVTQDRLAEKRLLERCRIPTARFAPAGDAAELIAALEVTGLPALVKTRRGGYDGKGQVFVGAEHAAELANAASARGLARRIWEELGGVPLVAESVVDFDRELSVVAARAATGEVVAFPLVENRHVDGILALTLAPAPELTPNLVAQGQAIAGRVLAELDHVGVATVELFQVAGTLVGNEIAPRVHNSGHWTIEGAETSQFEQHLRAVLGLPLGPADARAFSAMVNLVGEEPAPADVLAVPGAHLHRYGKAPRPGRKLGHVTVTAPDPQTRQQRVDEVLGACGLVMPPLRPAWRPAGAG